MENNNQISVKELQDGRVQEITSTGKYKSLEVVYLVENVTLTQSTVEIDGDTYPATTEYFALDAVRNLSEKTLYDLPRHYIKIEEKIDENTFKVSVNYQQYTSKSAGSAYIPGDDDDDTFNTNKKRRSTTYSGGGGTRHITHSYETIFRSEKSVNFRHAINVDTSKNINGVDIYTPSLTYSETRYLSEKKFTTSYVRTLNAMQGKVNSASFKGFSKGEVRFDSFTATRTGTKESDKYEVTYNFSIIPNQEAEEINGIKIPAKYGWDYLWFYTEPAVETDGVKSDLQLKVRGAYIERVYQFENFGKLKL